ncbi:enoyl-CoA hydratase/isomerase family protein [Chloroflexota bacterium]
MSYATLIYTKQDHIAFITLNRPDANNTINQRLTQELGAVCYQINQDNDVYVVVITGAGGKVFCGGGELEQLIQSGDTGRTLLANLENVSLRYSVTTTIASIDRPVIAALNGDALGQGLELALSCDIRLASYNTRFGFPHAALGLIPTDGGTQRLPRIVGKGKALELILTAEIISAEEAFEIGLVSKVVAEDALTAEVENLAKTIASKGPIALRYAKEAVNKGLDLTLEQGLRMEADLYFILHTTADRTEGIKAFLQKRPPRFKGA